MRCANLTWDTHSPVTSCSSSSSHPHRTVYWGFMRSAWVKPLEWYGWRFGLYLLLAFVDSNVCGSFFFFFGRREDEERERETRTDNTIMKWTRDCSLIVFCYFFEEKEKKNIWKKWINSFIFHGTQCKHIIKRQEKRRKGYVKCVRVVRASDLPGLRSPSLDGRQNELLAESKRRLEQVVE